MDVPTTNPYALARPSGGGRRSFAESLMRILTGADTHAVGAFEQLYAQPGNGVPSWI
jgi:hypothetical protein